ncbi:hypothetical protein [Sphaerisporangium corydalis]|uniref:Uncharacterized protein n=1 Tax=Sphaerisporangium corydalis TaxID=1441875 RepID=A0ABV9E9B2_9ACTN|nr:hypothetical protein [Sphaerisporangium corydalis]
MVRPTGIHTFTAFVRADGATFVRDPFTKTGLIWHDVSTLAGYPADVNDVSIAMLQPFSDSLYLTVRTSTGHVAQTRCSACDAGTEVWPNNCTPFVDITPPNL